MDVELSDKNCPYCGGHTLKRNCGCDDGLSHHDCGEDCCCCVNPEPNVLCDDCRGRGWHNWCPTCEWDLLGKRFLNGHDERQPKQPAS